MFRVWVSKVSATRPHQRGQCDRSTQRRFPSVVIPPTGPDVLSITFVKKLLPKVVDTSHAALAGDRRVDRGTGGAREGLMGTSRRVVVNRSTYNYHYGGAVAADRAFVACPTIVSVASLRVRVSSIRLQFPGASGRANSTAHRVA